MNYVGHTAPPHGRHRSDVTKLCEKPETDEKRGGDTCEAQERQDNHQCADLNAGVDHCICAHYRRNYAARTQ